MVIVAVGRVGPDDVHAPIGNLTHYLKAIPAVDRASLGVIIWLHFAQSGRASGISARGTPDC